MIPKKIFNPSILLALGIVAFSQFVFAENESNSYLDLSTEEIRNISIELKINQLFEYLSENNIINIVQINN
jgi:hypothetical protein